MINNYLKIKIIGKSPKSFLNYLIKMHINLLNIEYINNDIYISITENDYKKILKIKTSYKCEIVKRYGILNIKYIIKYHLIFFICCLISFLILNVLSNICFSIEVIHNDKDIRDLIIKDLNTQGIKKYRFMVSYNKKEHIADNILRNHKDRLEWIEITRVGVKYIVNIEERIINNKKYDTKLQNIVANKTGIIKKIDATSGEVIKKINDFVKKGDIIISGNIMKGDKVKAQTRAEGIVYAETWYVSHVLVPLKYKKERFTGKYRYLIRFRFNNKNIALFNSYKYYDDKDIFLLKNKLLPIDIGLVKRYDKKVMSYDFDYDEAIDHALILASNKLEDKLDMDEYIISKKVLKKTRKNSTIDVEVFFRIYENITRASDLIEMTEEDYKKQDEIKE